MLKKSRKGGDKVSSIKKLLTLLVSFSFVILYPFCSVTALNSCVKASNQMFRNLYEKLPTSSKEQHVTDSIKVAISIIFHSAAHLNACVQGHPDLKVTDPAELVLQVLTRFLCRNYGSIAGCIFDGPKEMKVHTRSSAIPCVLIS